MGSSLGAGREGALDLQTKKVWLVAITSAVGASEFTSHADIQAGSGYTFSFYGLIHNVSTVQILNYRHLFPNSQTWKQEHLLLLVWEGLYFTI